ncbi:MAG: KamA family radical SAM protein [Magnetococcales bacterium]|nr:KamA family radical SAM protein [Magnetococcales bacterium]
MEAWREQLKNQVNTLEKLEEFIHVTPEERAAIQALKGTRWGTTPHYANLMDKEDPACPIRRQVIPSQSELANNFGMEGYLIWKENRSTAERRPDAIARQYRDRIAFAVTQVCGIYCRHCFRRELTIAKDLKLRLDIDEGLAWIREHPEIRDVLITGGDPFLLGDDDIAYVIDQLRAIPHIEMIRFGTRLPVVLPQRFTPALLDRLRGYHRVPIWINTQCNHPKELTEETARVVYDLLTCGINVGNQAVLLKGINDNVAVFRALHQKLLNIRVRPYYLFYCEPAPGTDHFRTPLHKGAELIRDALRGHTTGLAQPLYVVATNIGKIPITLDDRLIMREGKKYVLTNYEGRTTELDAID